jgi:hypothetical protein
LGSALLTVRRGVAAVGIASLAFVAVAPPAGASTPSSELKTKIDTYSGWDGSSFLFPFGNPQTSNYGQVITIPEGVKKLKNYTFYMASNSGTGTLTMRGEVYGWDGTKATTKVSQSKKKTLDLTAGDPTYYPVKIKVKKGKVTPGQQYVIFLSVDKDYEDNPPNVLSQWACNYTDVLPGGSTVYLNSDGDEGQWTTVSWSQIPDFDMAMKATLK